MGAGLSSFDDPNTKYPEIYGLDDDAFHIPINPIGIDHKMTDSSNMIIYDLITKKSINENVQLEEYLLQVDNGKFQKRRDFVVISSKLRSVLKDADLLYANNRYETNPRICFNTCIADFPKIEFKRNKFQEIREFVSFIKENCILFEKIDEDIANGIIASTALGYYYKIGTKVLYRNGDITQGAFVDSVNLNLITLKGWSLNKRGKFKEFNYTVKLEVKVYTIDELHNIILPINYDDTIYQGLKERGAKIVNYKGKVKYLNYKGPLIDSKNIVCDRTDNVRVIADFLNDIPVTLEEKMEDLDENYSRQKLLDDIPNPHLFAVYPFIPVYNIANGKYIKVLFDNLEPIKFNDSYYDELVLDKKYKDFLSLVTIKHHQIDFIKGKGAGKLFILSGDPGLGKTMTVESLAEKFHVPLMVISFGCLGSTPEKVEQTLLSLTKLASYWNAMLLFDEADVFLEERSNSSDVVRNAIVGVFLQILEYHKGIVFLTTNRETSLDPAIRSRALIKIHYKPLTFDQSLLIWHNMLSRLTNKADDIILQLNPSEVHVTNGRDIRNIIHIAQILSGNESIQFEHIQTAISLHSN